MERERPATVFDPHWSPAPKLCARVFAALPPHAQRKLSDSERRGKISIPVISESWLGQSELTRMAWVFELLRAFRVTGEDAAIAEAALVIDEVLERAAIYAFRRVVGHSGVRYVPVKLATELDAIATAVNAGRADHARHLFVAASGALATLIRSHGGRNFGLMPNNKALGAAVAKAVASWKSGGRPSKPWVKHAARVIESAVCDLVPDHNWLSSDTKGHLWGTKVDLYATLGERYGIEFTPSIIKNDLAFGERAKRKKGRGRSKSR